MGQKKIWPIEPYRGETYDCIMPLSAISEEAQESVWQKVYPREFKKDDIMLKKILPIKRDSCGK